MKKGISPFNDFVWERNYCVEDIKQRIIRMHKYYLDPRKKKIFKDDWFMDDIFRIIFKQVKLKNNAFLHRYFSKLFHTHNYYFMDFIHTLEGFEYLVGINQKHTYKKVKVINQKGEW